MTRFGSLARSRPCLEPLEERTVPTGLHTATAGALLAAPPPSGPPAVANGPAPLALVQTSAAATGSGTTTSSPTLFQALVSLYIDGAFLEAESIPNQFVSNIDEFGIVPSVQMDAEAKAAAAGVNFDAALSLLQVLGRFRTLDTVGADIQFNLPLAGPFGLAALRAGAQAASQAVQL